jgi:hypothetical protein
MRKSIIWTIIGLWVVTGMFACGGGGGGDAAPATPVGTPVNLSQIKNFEEAQTPGSSISFNVTGSIGTATNLTGVLSLAVTAPTITSTPTGTQTVNVLVQNVNITNPATGASASATTTYYFFQTGLLFNIVNDDGTISTPISQTLLPASAKVGDSGADMVVSNSDGSTESSTWRIDPGTNGDAIFVYIFTDRDNLNVVTETSEDAYTIKPDGSISAVSTKFNDPGTGRTGSMSGNRN